MRDWSGDATKAFKGKIVKEIRYLTEEESEEYFGWYGRTPFIVFTDGSTIIPSSDDEGNSGGVFYTSDDTISVIPANGK